ncbi:MAG: type II toxin-antitoxin system RelE/ParE family toxin [Nanoarchaeota archaeon]
MFNIQWKEEAVKDLQKLERDLGSRIYKKVNSLKENFDSADIKRLQGSDLFRLRVGDYRIIFEINKELITILKIGHRKNIYKK